MVIFGGGGRGGVKITKLCREYQIKGLYPDLYVIFVFENKYIWEFSGEGSKLQKMGKLSCIKSLRGL